MLLSFALIIATGLALGQILKKLRLPSLVGMLIAGVLLSPSVLNLISPEVLNISADIRQICLIIILLRAGFALDISDLKKIGRPAILMCFIPATIEILATAFLAPMFFQISRLEGLILGAVLGAVSPAVIVPKMIKLIEDGYGKDKAIPQLILAGASVDDIYVIVLFTSFLGMYHGESFKIKSLISIPTSIILGVLTGVLIGALLGVIFNKIKIRTTVKILIIMCIAFFLISLENILKPYILVSGLLAIMTLAITIRVKNVPLAKKLSVKFSKIWVLAEIVLFVLVGASVDVSYALKAGGSALLFILLALCFRIIGVYICLLFTKLNKKERLFCAIAYLPKATVQAAIGGIPLAQGVASGDLILTICVLSILITAPLGATLIDLSYKKLLSIQSSS